MITWGFKWVFRGISNQARLYELTGSPGKSVATVNRLRPPVKEGGVHLCTRIISYLFIIESPKYNVLCQTLYHMSRINEHSSSYVASWIPERASDSSTVIPKYCHNLSWYSFNSWTRLWNSPCFHLHSKTLESGCNYDDFFTARRLHQWLRTLQIVTAQNQHETSMRAPRTPLQSAQNIVRTCRGTASTRSAGLCI